MASASTWSLERLDSLAEEVKAAIMTRNGSGSSGSRLVEDKPSNALSSCEKDSAVSSSSSDGFSAAVSSEEAEVHRGDSPEPPLDPTPSPLQSLSSSLPSESLPPIPPFVSGVDSDKTVSGRIPMARWDPEAMVLPNIVGALMAVNEV